VLEKLPGKKIMVGVINLDDMAIETPQKVVERAKRALSYVPRENIILAPDCGMKYLPREVAYGKMKALVEGARLLRAEYR
jgi:5-methyltetrahydropteroyltriglutamate--homocysteine methyltransferase